eukprot:scaffold1329_cov19-Tisochrysis_lutea.AAC.5
MKASQRTCILKSNKGYQGERGRMGSNKPIQGPSGTSASGNPAKARFFWTSKSSAMPHTTRKLSKLSDAVPNGSARTLRVEDAGMEEPGLRKPAGKCVEAPSGRGQCQLLVTPVLDPRVGTVGYQG